MSLFGVKIFATNVRKLFILCTGIHIVTQILTLQVFFFFYYIAIDFNFKVYNIKIKLHD